MASTIIIIHQGNPFYLKYVLRQAITSNPNAYIILLGDNTNENACGNNVIWVNIEEYMTDAKKFERIYQHASPNGYNYELFCFQRWLIFNEFLLKNPSLNNIVHLDSDVLLFRDVSFLQADGFALSCNYGGGPHTLFFHEKECIQELCSVIWDMFGIQSSEAFSIRHELQERYETNSLRPDDFWGISDMVAFKILENRYVANGTFRNLTEIQTDHSVFDCNINMNEGKAYQMISSGKRKKIKWIRHTPHVWNTFLKKNIRFNALHLQGDAKYLIPKYAQYKSKKTEIQYWNDYFLVYLPRSFKNTIKDIITFLFRK